MIYRYDGAPPFVIWTDDNAILTAGLTQTHSGLSFSSARSNRLMIASIASSGPIDAGRTVTIGGVSATFIVRATNAAILDIWVANVPTGTSGSVVITHPSNSMSCSSVSLYAAYNLRSFTAHDTASDGVFDVSMTIDIPARGLCVGGAMCRNNDASPGTASWSGLSEDFEGRFDIVTQNLLHSTASRTTTTAESGLAVAVASLSGFRSGVAASFS